MGHRGLCIAGCLLFVACGGSSTGPKIAGEDKPAANEFQTQKSSTAGTAHGVAESKIKATMTMAAMKFFVVDKETNDPMTGVVISLKAESGKKYYTGETDAVGYGEVLVPLGQSYEVVYLSLGKEKITAKVKVSDEPMQNIKLTLRYKPYVDETVEVLPEVAEDDPPPPEAAQPAPVFRLDGVIFESNSSELLPESYPRLDSVAEYMTYKPSSRIEVAGHTDNVGSAKKNKVLSLKRAESCRLYLMGKGVDGSRIEAVGHGQARPVASNKSDEGRQKNRRIEAKELGN